MSDLTKKPPAGYAPMYCAMYPQLAEIARGWGYALMVHGSMNRDFDLLAVPWIAKPRGTPEDIITEFEKKFHFRRLHPDSSPHPHAHGRMVYTLSIGWGECAIDIGFMPVQEEHYADPFPKDEDDESA